ncbi:MAG: DoxX family protein [Bacilli bacterium]|nr:DoxX family protein [Bacilli bacterium]
MKDFERFKKKVLREHIIKSALVGLGIGLLAAALAIVISFLTNPAAAVWTGIIAGVLFAGAGGYYYWYKTKPTDKKIALRLDKKLGLHEKCATMIEFQEKEGALLEKQREDATTTLAEKPTKALKFSVGIWVIPALAVASAFFTAAFFTPQNANNPGVSRVEDSDNLDSLTKSIGDDIKSNIDDNSAIDSALRSIFDSVVDQLESSLMGVSDPNARSEMVSDARGAISSILDEWNSKEEIGKALKTEPDQHLKDQGQDLIEGDIPGLRQDFQDLFDDLSQLEGEELREYAGELADQIDDALEKAVQAGVSTDDDLYKVYKELANRLRSIEEMPTDQQPSSGEQQSGSQQTNYESQAQQAVESAIAQAASNAASNVSQQNENEAMASAIQSMMESLVNPQQGSEASGSGESGEPQQTDGSGSGSGSGTAIPTEASGSGSGSGSGQPGSGSGQPGSEPGQPSSGDQPGSGSGSGVGPGQVPADPHTDIIYTGDGTVEYGSVIDSYGGAYTDDHAHGDTDDGDTADDYFKNLYGEDGQGGGK